MAVAREEVGPMTRPLRSAHRRIWSVLPLVVALVVIAGVMARRTTTPPNANLRWERIK